MQFRHGMQHAIDIFRSKRIPPQLRRVMQSILNVWCKLIDGWVHEQMINISIIDVPSDTDEMFQFKTRSHIVIEK